MLDRGIKPERAAFKLSLCDEVVPCTCFWRHVWVASRVVVDVKAFPPAHTHGDALTQKIAEACFVKTVIVGFAVIALQKTVGQ